MLCVHVMCYNPDPLIESFPRARRKRGPDRLSAVSRFDHDPVQRGGHPVVKPA